MKVRKVTVGSLIPISFLCLLLISGFMTDHIVNLVNSNVYTAVNRSCVIIDAGHGGVDGGAVSCTGVYESDINLEISQKLNDLMHLLGINTKMIRTEDISIYSSGDSIAAKKISDLKERVKIVNSTKNGILISIHQNYFTDSRYRGAQVFYSKNSSALAKQLQNDFVTFLNNGSKRKAKYADGIYLMQNITVPGALIECGFLSNPEEEALLRNHQYQQKICCVICSSVSRYIYKSSIA